MALMFGAVVFVSSCGDEGGSSDCKTCTVKITQRNDGAADTDSKAYPSGEFCGDNLAAVQGKNGASADATDAADGKDKGGKYSVACN